MHTLSRMVMGRPVISRRDACHGLSHVVRHSSHGRFTRRHRTRSRAIAAFVHAPLAQSTEQDVGVQGDVDVPEEPAPDR